MDGVNHGWGYVSQESDCQMDVLGLNDLQVCASVDERSLNFCQSPDYGLVFDVEGEEGTNGS